MKEQLDFRAVTKTLLVGSIGTYALCIAGDVLFGWKMYLIWQPLLPGFVWPLTWAGFLIGVVWLIGYSFYGAALVVLPYNYFLKQNQQRTETPA